MSLAETPKSVDRVNRLEWLMRVERGGKAAIEFPVVATALPNMRSDSDSGDQAGSDAKPASESSARCGR
jgi:hypothetical protein